jgi:AraC-like DNA-binding protein/ligand-binding sensor protein
MKSRAPHDELLFGSLKRSDIYRDYKEAFSAAVGLPLELHKPDGRSVIRPTDEGMAPFCAVMARTNQTCQACYALQRDLEEQAGFAARTLKCFAGLCETAVPVRVGGKLIAFLHTGHVFLDRPDAACFNRIASLLLEWGHQVDLKRMEEAYFATRLFTPAQYESVVRLLEIFAKHLSACADQLLLVPQSTEPASVARARRMIEASSHEELTLPAVARVVNVSATYFSQIFHKSVGIPFVEYVARVRVEKAKNLLLNPNLRISEIAFEVGFQSISQFNRAFRRITGTTPKQYRETQRSGILGDASS